jgi:4-amino-4-deoxy-L-arabinose transferase-like glycosyltransferase
MRSFIVTDIEAGKLPRWGLLMLCLLYVLPGLVARDPWRTDDAASFGIALTMSRGGPADWLMPNIAGLPMPDRGPLPFWIDALLARLTDGWLTEHAAVRLTTALLLAAMLALVWYASFALARRPGVQPSDPFGASASSTDFGRAIADSALLVLMATFGLIARMHETTGNVAQLAWVAAFLFGCASALERPGRGGLIAGAAIAATMLTGGLPMAMVLVAVLVTLCALVGSFRLVARLMLPAALIPALVGMLIWPLFLAAGDDAARQHLLGWLQAQLRVVSGPTADSLGYMAQTMPWFYWPAWPVAAWAAWRWRSRWSEPAVALPLFVTVGFTLQALGAPTGAERLLLPAAVPMALLAGVGMPTLRRGIVSLIDWFALTSFSLFGIAIWAWWIALMTGYPPRMAYRASRLAPGYEPTWVAIEIVLGGLATLAWVALVRWRIARRPRMIWRAMALSCGGLVLAWFLAMTLWLPVFNERNTYRDVALGLHGALAAAPGDCVRTRGLGVAERASFLYFARPRFAEAGHRAADDRAPAGHCGWLLIQDNRGSTHVLPGQDAALVWRGQRRGDPSESFRLYRIATPGPRPAGPPAGTAPGNNAIPRSIR